MKFTTNLLAVCLLIGCVLFNSSLAQKQERDIKKEEKVWQQLQKIAPKSVDKFKSATAALDRAKYDEAVKFYGEVLAQAPAFEPALRRMGNALAASGKRDEGLKLTQQAVDINRSPENLISHALNLTAAEANNYEPTESDFKQALALAKEAMRKDTENDPAYISAAAGFAISANNAPEFRALSKLLAEKHPDLMQTHYFNAIRFADDDNFSAAEAEVRKAESLGLPPATAQEMQAGIARAKSEPRRSNSASDDSYGFDFGLGNYFYYPVYLVAAWLVGLAGLFVAGKILSAKTLRSLEKSDPNDVTGGGHAGLRKIYKNLITVAGVYYYVSQPIVMLLVAVVALWIALFFIWIGRIPIKLMLIVAFIAAATIFYMIKSLFARTETGDPGRVLSEAEAPDLWILARDVAAAVNTRPINEIRLTHGAELAVYERGSFTDKMQDKAERILIVGVAALNDFSQNAFRAVLAHEYGHFSNRDTAGGAVANRVNSDIMRLAEAMARSGTANGFNIAFQFLRVYHFLFRRITHGATRLQEILADRVAVHLYGADAFREGLSHVIRRDIEFHHVADKEINAAFSGNRAMQNLYEMTEQDESAQKNLAEQFDAAVNRPTTEDDTHPSPSDRFRLANQIKTKEIASLNGTVWDLFKDRAAITNEMNRQLEANIRANF